jgi:predicted dehydrogenase
MSVAVARRKRRRPRLGFLGVGWIGRQRLEAVLESGVADVVMISDTSLSAALDASALCCDVEIGSGLPDLLAGGIDGVVIATPSALHAAQAAEALAAGLAVFCQKPLATTAAETRRVVEQARSSNRLLGVDFSYRYLEGSLIARSQIAAGEIGKVYSVEAEFHNAYGPDKSWSQHAGLAGGGCLIDLGVHLADLALWMLDYPPVTSATGRLFSKGHPYKRGLTDGVEDYAVARVDLGPSATVSIACSWHRHIGQPAAIRLACLGTHGALVVENVDGSFYDFRCWRMQGTSRELLSGPGEEWGARAIVDWAEELAAGGRFNEQACHYVQVADVLDRIYAS